MVFTIYLTTKGTKGTKFFKAYAFGFCLFFEKYGGKTRWLGCSVEMRVYLRAFKKMTCKPKLLVFNGSGLHKSKTLTFN